MCIGPAITKRIDARVKETITSRKIPDNCWNFQAVFLKRDHRIRLFEIRLVQVCDFFRRK